MKKNLFLLGVGILLATQPAYAYLTALEARRILFTFQNETQEPELNAGEEVTVRVDGLNFIARLDRGIDLRTCKASVLNNPAKNVLASAEIIDEKNGLIKLVAGTAAGRAKLVLKCRGGKKKIMVVTVR